MVDPLRSLLRASHLLAAERLPAVVAEHARAMGARDLVLYLTDYEQSSLVALPGEGVPERQVMSIDSSLAGRAFRRVEVVRSATHGGHRLWLPLLNGMERLGVVEAVLHGEPDDDLEEDLRALVSLTAELIVANAQYSDVYARVRRRRSMSLAAEIQWELLPPLTFGTDRVVITGGLEPAYEIGGDTFDYSVTDGTADLLVLDSVGHGLPAAVLAGVAVGAYRHARRSRLDLPDIAREMDEAIAGQFTGSQFATAVIARLDVESGQLRWVNAGHPDPLVLRAGELVLPPRCPPSRPLGLQDGRPTTCTTRLEPGDRLVLYTDGITEARSPDGEFFGEARLAEFILAAASAGDPAPETVRQLMRRVLEHQADQLQDDASIVMLEWRTGEEWRIPSGVAPRSAVHPRDAAR
ncbi:PP2C family protein-serine/threonine phosphatase [Modestobacter altitudinis]|uniref:PP2C family protein-serine/threonine phosphatase n=1 Tax=Modestobacter altitudinis TaxID=2213158 RepID=UPI001FE9641D|nr:SpoIIE family protein phosphatase [Modestobacter altitudinis]